MALQNKGTKKAKCDPRKSERKKEKNENSQKQSSRTKKLNTFSNRDQGTIQGEMV